MLLQLHAPKHCSQPLEVLDRDRDTLRERRCSSVRAREFSQQYPRTEKSEPAEDEQTKPKRELVHHRAILLRL